MLSHGNLGFWILVVGFSLVVVVLIISAFRRPMLIESERNSFSGLWKVFFLLVVVGFVCFVLGGAPGVAMHKFREMCWGVGLNAPANLDVTLDPADYPIDIPGKKITIAKLPDGVPPDTKTVVTFDNGNETKVHLVKKTGDMTFPPDTSGVSVYLYSEQQGSTSRPLRITVK